MLAIHDIPGTVYHQIPVPASAAADATADLAIMVAPYKCKVISVEFFPTAAVTGQATNYRTLAVNNDTQTAQTIASLALSTSSAGSLVATASNPLTLSTTAAYLLCAAGDVLAFNSAKTGTGIIVPTGTLRIGIQGN